MIQIQTTLFFVIATLVFFGSITFSQAEAQITPYTSTSEEIEALFVKVQEYDQIQVIIGLNVEYELEGEMLKMQSGTDAINSQREKIRDTQNALLSELNESSYFDSTSFVSKHHNYKYIPYMSMTVNEDILKQLVKSSRVSSITEDVPMPLALSESIPLIEVDDIWNLGSTGAGQTIAILDTGVDKNHPFLAGKIVSEACYSNDVFLISSSLCPNGEDEETGAGSAEPCIDLCDHGTHVAGIAAGNGVTFSGVAKDADLIAIQVFAEFYNPICSIAGKSSPCVLSYPSDQIKGMERVHELSFDEKFDISSVNMSIGGLLFPLPCDILFPSTKAIIDQLRSVGIATIISSGNDYSTIAISFPACISSAISVGSVDDGGLDLYNNPTIADQVSDFSNSVYFLDLLAPGAWITSSVPGGLYETWSGTSMAAPHVAGAWAVLKSQNPEASVDYILDSLVTNGKTIPDDRGPIDYSFSRINVYASSSNICIPSMIQPSMYHKSFPIEASEFYEGSRASGTATIYTSDETCSFDKVIIIPEGIDPLNDLNADGLFSILDVYNLTGNLMAHDYDIIILDYDDGADYIQNNGLLLVELINQINDKKNGDEELVIIGPSMGGIVAQYALTYMENNSLDHETRLYMSLDSPHKGANVSLGNQYWLKYFSVLPVVQDVIDDYFNNYAVKQLVVYHESTSPGISIPPLPNLFVATVEEFYLDVGDFAPNELFTDLHNELADMGDYPQNLRKVAISNGNGHSIGQGFTPNDGILLWEETGNAGTINGNTKAVPNETDDQVQIFHGLLDWNDINLLNPDNERHEFNVFANNTLPFDNAPGSISPFTGLVEKFNPIAGTIELGPIVLNYDFGEIHVNNVETFIPTISSLDIDIEDPFYNIAGDPNILDITPFDAIYYPTDNQNHMFITNENVEWFLKEILSCGLPEHGTWIITRDCTVQVGGTVIDGDIIVKNSATLTIAPTVEIDIDFENHSLIVEQGSGVLIKKGGTIT